jgi:putative ribosome biogenesis GTPase RsgA
VGDWVVIRPRPENGKVTIHAVLPRKSKFARIFLPLSTANEERLSFADFFGKSDTL